MTVVMAFRWHMVGDPYGEQSVRIDYCTRTAFRCVWAART